MTGWWDNKVEKTAVTFEKADKIRFSILASRGVGFNDDWENENTWLLGRLESGCEEITKR